METNESAQQAALPAPRSVQEKTMELTALGFDGWFEQHSTALLQPGQSVARVTAVDRDAFLIRSQAAERYSELAGKLRFETQSAMDLPCVGDWVCAQWPASEGPALIHAVVPRKTLLRRKRPGTTVDLVWVRGEVRRTGRASLAESPDSLLGRVPAASLRAPVVAQPMSPVLVDDPRR